MAERAERRRWYPRREQLEAAAEQQQAEMQSAVLSGRPRYAGTVLVQEMAKAAASFEYFLYNHVWITDRSLDGTSSVIKWQHWSIHDVMCSDMRNERMVIWLKSRQIGASWVRAAWKLWRAMFQPGYLGGIISAGETEATEFLRKCKAVYDNLPYAMKPSLDQDNTEILKFKATGGAIMAFPSTAKAGRGFTFTEMTVDEAAFHPFASVNYASYSGAMAPGGQILMMSSAGDGTKQATTDFFAGMWNDAVAGVNGFKATFFDRYARPDRTAAWELETRRRFAGNPSQFSREFPATPAEALQSLLLLRFDPAALEVMKQQCYEPLREAQFPPGVDTRYVRIWSVPRHGVAYVAYTDASENKGRDYTVTMIFEAATLRHVCTLRENTLEPTKHGYMAYLLCLWYNLAFWGVERNKGEAILYMVGQVRYPTSRMYWHEERITQKIVYSGREPTRRPGFPVTADTRNGLIDGLGDVIADNAIFSPDREFWDECSVFIINERGRAEAAPGRHDDQVMAAAGAVRMARAPGARLFVAPSTMMMSMRTAEELMPGQAAQRELMRRLEERNSRRLSAGGWNY